MQNRNWEQAEMYIPPVIICNSKIFIIKPCILNFDGCDARKRFITMLYDDLLRHWDATTVDDTVIPENICPSYDPEPSGRIPKGM